MKTIIFIVLMIAGVHNSLSLTLVERQKAMDQLVMSKTTFLASIDGLSKAQPDFKPGPGKWSIAGVAEHICLAEAGLGGIVQQTL